MHYCYQKEAALKLRELLDITRHTILTSFEMQLLPE
jgi:hypothetical protein